jgi:hypothetical protein
MPKPRGFSLLLFCFVLAESSIATGAWPGALRGHTAGLLTVTAPRDCAGAGPVLRFVPANYCAVQHCSAPWAFARGVRAVAAGCWAWFDRLSVHCLHCCLLWDQQDEAVYETPFNDKNPRRTMKVRVGAAPARAACLQCPLVERVSAVRARQFVATMHCLQLGRAHCGVVAIASLCCVTTHWVAGLFRLRVAAVVCLQAAQ